MKIHAGERVKEVLVVSGMSVSEFARRLNCHRQNVYDIFKRQDINLSLLKRISRVLEHDFVSEFYATKTSSRITIKLAVTIEIENGQYHITNVQQI